MLVGATGVWHRIVVRLTFMTVHGWPPTLTTTGYSALLQKSSPSMVSSVPPCVLPVFGETLEMTKKESVYVCLNKDSGARFNKQTSIALKCVQISRSRHSVQVCTDRCTTVLFSDKHAHIEYTFTNVHTCFEQNVRIGYIPTSFPSKLHTRLLLVTFE